MINPKNKCSEYFCMKDRKHHEVGAAGQKKRCWLCGAKMSEKPAIKVVCK